MNELDRHKGACAHTCCRDTGSMIGNCLKIFKNKQKRQLSSAADTHTYGVEEYMTLVAVLSGK